MGKGYINLTKLIKVCVDAILTGHRANQASFQEGAPSIHQHSLSSLIILRNESTCSP